MKPTLELRTLQQTRSSTITDRQLEVASGAVSAAISAAAYTSITAKSGAVAISVATVSTVVGVTGGALLIAATLVFALREYDPNAEKLSNQIIDIATELVNSIDLSNFNPEMSKLDTIKTLTDPKTSKFTKFGIITNIVIEVGRRSLEDTEKQAATRLKQLEANDLAGEQSGGMCMPQEQEHSNESSSFSDAKNLSDFIRSANNFDFGGEPEKQQENGSEGPRDR